MPVEAMVLVEPSILCRDHRVLEVGRNPVEPYEDVPLVIRLLVHPGLHPPLDVYGSEWRIYPTHG